MRILPLTASVVALSAVLSRTATRESVSSPALGPQPIGITAALMMDAQLADSRIANKDNLPVPGNGSGPRVAVGDAEAAKQTGAHYFVPAETLLRTTPLSFVAPALEIAPRDLWRRRHHFRIVDVREAEEFAASRVPGSVRRSMFSDFSHEAKPVALFCLTGHRSAALVARLHAHDVKNVFSVRGGWLDWNAEGLPLSTVEIQPTVEAS